MDLRYPGVGERQAIPSTIRDIRAA